MKFSRLPQLAGPLARALAQRLRQEDVEADLIVPVPLHWRRRLARGYDQSEELGRAAALHLGLDLRKALRRQRPTAPQSTLPRADRALNLKGAFRAVRGLDLREKKVLLIDDVVTSGATLRAAALALKQAGTASVIATVVARTPSPEEAAALSWRGK